MERTATFIWYGPFFLAGGKYSKVSERLIEIENFKSAERGLYFFVGSMNRVFRRNRIRYVGQTDKETTERPFLARCREHLQDNDGAKLTRIERCGRVQSIWLGKLLSFQQVVPSNKSELDAWENLLINALMPKPGRRSRRKCPIHLNDKDFGSPEYPCVMINRFNTDLWEARERRRWLPHAIPDIIDCHVVDDRVQYQLIWTGTRGLRPHRASCGPGSMMNARPSKPAAGANPSL